MTLTSRQCFRCYLVACRFTLNISNGNGGCHEKGEYGKIDTWISDCFCTEVTHRKVKLQLASFSLFLFFHSRWSMSCKHAYKTCKSVSQSHFTNVVSCDCLKERERERERERVIWVEVVVSYIHNKNKDQSPVAMNNWKLYYIRISDISSYNSD